MMRARFHGGLAMANERFFRRKRRRRDVRPHTEQLEFRRLLATVAWDGGGNGTSWTDPLNWSGNTIPTSADDITIPAGVSGGVRIGGATASARSLVASSDISIATFGSLTVAQTATLEAEVTLGGGKLIGGTWTT